MSTIAPCFECGAGWDEPCASDCRCLHCALVNLPVPKTVEQALHAANVATFEGRPLDAQINMIRLHHIAKGLADV